MINQKKISSSQVFVLLFLFKIFFLMMQTQNSTNSTDYSLFVIGQVACVVLLLILLIPYYIICKKDSRDIFILSGEISPIFNKITSLLYAGVCLLLAVSTLYNFVYFLTEVFYPFMPIEIFIFVMIIAVCYALYLGIEPIARLGGFVLVIALLGFAFIIPGVASEINPSYFHGLSAAEPRSLATAIYSGVPANQDLILLLLMPSFVNDKNTKGLFGYLLFSCAFYAFIIYLIITVLGDYVAVVTFPLYALSSIANLSIIQRMDSVFMMIWVCVAFLRLSFLLTAMDYSLGFILKRDSKSRRYFLAILCAIISVIIFSYQSFAERFNLLMSSGILSLLSLAFFPLVLIIFTKIKESLRINEK